jgi:transcriptional regulator with XRE-family HTH domain
VAKAPRRASLQTRLANSLKRERGRKDWTQERAAEAARLNPRHYQKLEEGSVNVTLRTLDRLCKAFGMDIAELFGR